MNMLSLWTFWAGQGVGAAEGRAGLGFRSRVCRRDTTDGDKGRFLAGLGAAGVLHGYGVRHARR